MKCLICSQPKREQELEVYALTPQEKADLIKQGLDPFEEYAYCKPCLRILQDPEHGPSFMRGAFEHKLIEIGVPRVQAKKLADTYRAKLQEFARKTRHGTQA